MRHIFYTVTHTIILIKYCKTLRKFAHAILRDFLGVKFENFIGKNDIVNIFAKNIDCGYTLEPPRRGGSNEYQQSMFWNINKKNIDRYPCKPQFCYIKVGLKGVYITRTYYRDEELHNTICALAKMTTE